jgi:acetolactate synthase-1/2/3 large subunit
MDQVKQRNQSAAHPLAGEAMSGAQIIVQVLADEGVTAIFGYSGGAILPTYDAVFTFNEAQRLGGRPDIPLIVPANEQGAGFMAAGYARASGRVGVCLVTSGPGATNTVTPVRDCMADSVPIVVICGAGTGRGDRHRRLSGSSGGRADGFGRQARVPDHRPDAT